MPAKTGAPHELPYNLQGDKPPSLEAITKPLAERVHERLDAIDLSQLEVPGGTADDGKLVIVKDGAAAYSAMKGDATIAEDGTLSIGVKKIITEMLADLGVTTAKMANNSVTLAKIAEALGLTDAYIAAANKDGAAGTPSMRTLGTGSKQAVAGNDVRLVPTGALLPAALAAAPEGWLLCNGAAISRTTYSALFAAIGTAYGAGNGSTTFNVPDLQGRVAVGKGTHADVDALGESDGEGTVSNRRVKHAHPVSGATAKNTAAIAVQGPAAPGLAAAPENHSHTFSVTSDAAGPSFLVVNYIIKT